MAPVVVLSLTICECMKILLYLHGEKRAPRRSVQVKFAQKAPSLVQCVLGHWAISAETPSWGRPNEEVGLAPWGAPETREVRLWKSVPGGKSARPGKVAESHCGGQMLFPPATKMLDCLPLAPLWRSNW